MHVIASVRNVTERMPGENKAEIGGIVLRSRSPFHSSGSGTARRIQTVNSAGIIPTRNTYRGSNLPSNPTVNAAPIIPHIVWGAQRIWTKDHPKKMFRPKVPIVVVVGEPIQPTLPAPELTTSRPPRLR